MKYKVPPTGFPNIFPPIPPGGLSKKCRKCRKSAENVGKVRNFVEILKTWLELLEFVLLDIPWIETDLSLALEN